MNKKKETRFKGAVTTKSMHREKRGTLEIEGLNKRGAAMVKALIKDEAANAIQEAMRPLERHFSDLLTEKLNKNTKEATKVVKGTVDHLKEEVADMLTDVVAKVKKEVIEYFDDGPAEPGEEESGENDND